MVEGLLAAAEMADFLADRKEVEAARLLQHNKIEESKISKEVEAELRHLATSLRTRATETNTGEFIRIGEGTESGWAPKRRRTKPTGEVTGVTTVEGKPRKRRRRKTWISRLAFWR